MCIAMDKIATYREEHALRFQFINQIHDALKIETKRSYIDQCKHMFNVTMGAIDIPVGGTFGVLRLGVDVDVMTRWGEKVA